MRRTPWASCLHPALLTLAFLAAGCVRVASRPPPPATVRLRILGINDLHGQLEASSEPTRDGLRPAGVAVLAAYLRAAQAERPHATLLVSAGDLIGNSPPLSSILQDEPTIAALDALAGDACTYLAPGGASGMAALAGDARCDLVAVPGNHELEEGLGELLRVTRGGEHPTAPGLERPWRGARFPFIAANIVERASGHLVFPAAVVRELGGVRVGIVGAVLRQVPDLVDPGTVDELDFLDVAESVNAAVRGLAAQGVHTVIVVVHDGARQDRYPGPTRADAPKVTGPVATLVGKLDGEVDVVVAGHYHAFTNAWLPNAAGRQVLVTQAYSAGAAFDQIDLEVDPATGEVVASSAEIVPAVAGVGPGSVPDPAVARVVEAARARVAPIFDRVVATTAAAATRGALRLEDGDSGEWILGDVVADAFRAAMKADLALVQPGTLRADLPAGSVTWGQLYSALPFQDSVVRLTMSGHDLEAVLEQQWMPEPRPYWRPEPYVLQVSGFEVRWDGSRPTGERIVALMRGGQPLRLDATYTVAMPAALAAGGDRFETVARLGRDRVVGPLDTAAVEAYLAAQPQPFAPPAAGRISRVR
jgi:5'-nucleotidase